MGYIVCKRCGGYYELQEGESPEEFTSCECGGELEYVENLDVDPKSEKFDVSNQKTKISKIISSGKNRWMNFSSRMKIASSGGLVILLILIAFLFVGNINAAHYNDDTVSFDYPTDWEVSVFLNESQYSDSEAGSVTNYTELNVEGSGINTASIKYYTIDEKYLDQFKADLQNKDKKTVNGYECYETISTGDTNSRCLAVLINGNQACTILIAGDKDKVESGYNMILNSFKFNTPP